MHGPALAKRIGLALATPPESQRAPASAAKQLATLAPARGKPLQGSPAFEQFVDKLKRVTAIESQAVVAEHAPLGSNAEQCAVATAQGRRAELNRTWHVITHCIGPMFTALVNDPLIAQACEQMLDSDVMYAAISAGAADGRPSGSANPREFTSIYDAAKAAGSAMAAPTTGALVPVSAAAAAGAQQDCARCGKKHPTELCYSGTDDRTKPLTRLPEHTMTPAAKVLKAQVLANRPRRRRRDDREDGGWEYDRGYDRRGRPGYDGEPRERSRETSRDTRGAGFGGERGRPQIRSGGGSGDRRRN